MDVSTLPEAVLRRTPRHLIDQLQAVAVDGFCMAIGTSSYILFVLVTSSSYLVHKCYRPLHSQACGGQID